MAKIQQSIPEWKRDAGSVLGSVSADLLYDETSTSRAGGVLAQMDFIPILVQQLQDSPNKVTESFEEIRKTRELNRISFYYYLLNEKTVSEPSGIRFSVTGNVLDVKQPRSVWAKYFGALVRVFSVMACIRLTLDCRRRHP